MANFMAACSELGMGNGIAIIRELIKRIECPICLMPMHEPKSLGCKHMTCGECLIELKLVRNFKNVRKMVKFI